MFIYLSHITICYLCEKKGNFPITVTSIQEKRVFYFRTLSWRDNWKLCHHLLTLISFQTCMTFFCGTLRKIFRALASKQGLIFIVLDGTFSKYLLLCSTQERNEYKFGRIWGWVSDERIFIFNLNTVKTGVLIWDSYSCYFRFEVISHCAQSIGKTVVTCNTHYLESPESRSITSL